MVFIFCTLLLLWGIGLAISEMQDKAPRENLRITLIAITFLSLLFGIAYATKPRLIRQEIVPVTIMDRPIKHMPGIKEPVQELETIYYRDILFFHKESPDYYYGTIYVDLMAEKPWNPRRIEADLGPALRKGPLE